MNSGCTASEQRRRRLERNERVPAMTAERNRLAQADFPGTGAGGRELGNRIAIQTAEVAQ